MSGRLPAARRRRQLLDVALETFAAAVADDVHALAGRKNRGEHLLAQLRCVSARYEADLAPDSRRRHVGLFVMTRQRLADFGRCLFDEPQLNRLVSVGLLGLRLHDNARAGLDHGGRVDGAVGVEDLRHADFFADDASNHARIPVGACSLTCVPCRRP